MTIADTAAMRAAIDHAASVRVWTAPNPWVGAIILDECGEVSRGATAPPGGPHAEVVALAAADPARCIGATMVVTLEPCCHQGRTGACTQAIIAAGIARVVVGTTDPDRRVSGAGIAELRAAGVEVVVGVEQAAVEAQLAPYLKQRRLGIPYVVAKAAVSLDGRSAAVDGTSQWITGDEARRDGHRLRAESQAIVVGAATVRSDDPALTVRGVEGHDPLRVVMGSAPANARMRPCLEWSGSPQELLADLGERQILQVLIEGGASVLRSFHDAGLIDRYIVYLAPALFGGSDGTPLLAGPTAASIDDIWRGRLDAVTMIGGDIRVDIVPAVEER